MNKLLNNLLGMYKQAKLNKQAEETKECAKKDYTEQYAKVKEIMKEYGYGLSDGGYIYLISKEEPKDEGFQVKFKGDRLRVELDGKLKYSGYGPEAIEEFLKGMFYAKKLSYRIKALSKKAGWKIMTPKDLTEEVKDEFLKKSLKDDVGDTKNEDFYLVKGIKENKDDQFSYYWTEGMFGEWRKNAKGEKWYSLSDYANWDYIYLIKEDKLYKMPKRESLIDFGLVSSKRVKLTKKADYTKEEIEMINKEKEKQIECGEMIWRAKNALYGNKVEECKEVVKQMPKNCKLNFVVNVKREGEDKYYKKEINEIFKVIPQSLINEADEILKENPNTLYVSEWYRKSSKAKAVRKQAKIELVEGVWYKVFGYPLSVKYLGEGKGGMKRFEKADGTEIIFDADVEIEPYEYSYSPFSNDKQATKKKAVLQESENGLGYVLPNGQVVYPEDEAYLKSEYKANKQMLEKDKKELERLEGIIKKYPDINFDKNKDSVKFQIPRVKKGIEYLELFNETIEEILNAFKENKLPRQATKKQAKKLEFEDDIVEVTDKKGKVIYEGMFDYLDYDMKEDFYNPKKTKWMGNKYKMNLTDGEYYLKVRGNKNSKLNKSATIKHENGVYNVYSESGKCLGKGYKTKEEAEKRLKQVEYFKHKDKKAAIGYDFYGPKIMPDEAEGTFRIKYYGGPGKIDYLRKSKNGKYHWVEQTHFDYNNDKPFETTDYELAKKLVDQFGGEIETVANKQTKNKRTSLKQVVISKMAKSLKDIPDSVKKNILSDLVYVILTGKGSFAYKTVAKKLETIIKELGYGDKLKANEDGSLPTMEIVELISKEPKAMELVGKFANITRAF